MPKIGRRMIKTVVAIFLSMVISSLRPDAIPFYAAIAAFVCMQKGFEESKLIAIGRALGTVAGGIIGCAILLLFKAYTIFELPVLRYAIISILVLGLIYLTVLFKAKHATQMTCVVFLCITVNHIGDLNPYLFTFNRIADTLLGIFVSLAVNYALGWKQKTT